MAAPRPLLRPLLFTPQRLSPHASAVPGQAEHALALTFSLARNLHLSHQRVASGNYALSGLVGFGERPALGQSGQL